MDADELAFLRAIRAAPGDDLPRLAFADWLEEHAGEVVCERCKGKKRRLVRVRAAGGLGAEVMGKCPTCSGTGRVPDSNRARAEFIRLGCQRATRAVRRRRRELLKANRYGWCPLLGEDLFVRSAGPELYVLRKGSHERLARLSFRRGFVASVECRAAVWLAHGDAVRERHPVERVRLADWPEVDWPELRTARRDDGRGSYRVGWRLDGDPDPDWCLPFEELDRAARAAPCKSQIQLVCEARWPGVAFEIPPAPGFGPSPLRAAFPAWRLREDVRRARADPPR